MKHIHLTTRTILVATALPLLVALGACQTSTSSSTSAGTSTVPTQVPSERTVTENAPSQPASPAESASDEAALAAYKDVLLGQADLNSTEQSANTNLTQLAQTLGGVSFEQFALVDLDKDGTPEVVLSESDSTGFEILRYQAETVYGYNLDYRAFEELKNDGTFTFSSGAADNGIGTISFTTTSYTVTPVTYSQSSTDAAGNTTVVYFVDGASSTQDAFTAATNQQSDKPDVSWSDFTPDNVNSQL